jgi:hypothetical protein
MQLPELSVELRRRQHAEIRAEVDKRLLQNADNFDKAVLSYSAAGLALSLGFLKDFVPIDRASLPLLLYGSWAFFVLAVVVTICSYLTSQLAQRRQLDISYTYNIELIDEAIHLPNPFARATEISSYVAGGSFVLALCASTLFVGFNLSRSDVMTERRGVLDGATVPTIQKVPQVDLQRGAPVPTLQSIPQPQPTPSPPATPTAPQAPAGSK